MTATLLCIDDDAKAVEALRAAVPEGVTLIACADLEEAFELLFVEQPDLVVSELQLRDGNGLDFVERMRRSRSEVAATPVIVVTRLGRTPGVYGRATQLGVVGYFGKPAPRRELADAIREQLEKGTGARPARDRSHEVGIGAGRLADLPLSELLDRVHRRAESGVLIVGDARERTGIQIRNGSPVAVSLPRDEGIDEFLIRKGRLSAEDREAAIARAPLGLGSVEGLLLDTGLVDDETLEAALRQQGEEAIFQLFELEKGRYRFEPGRRLRGARSLDVVRSAQSFIVRGILAWSPVEKVREALDRYADLYVASNSEPDAQPDDVPCSDAQRDFVAALAGERCVADFLGGSEFELRTLYAFAILGSVALSAEPMLVLDDAAALEAPPAETVRDEVRGEVLELDDAIEEDPDLSHEDLLFDGSGESHAIEAAEPDFSYEEDLFEARAFEEDSFEQEMVAEESSGEQSLLDIDRLVAGEPESESESGPESSPEAEAPVHSDTQAEPEVEALPTEELPDEIPETPLPPRSDGVGRYTFSAPPIAVTRERVAAEAPVARTVETEAEASVPEPEAFASPAAAEPVSEELAATVAEDTEELASQPEGAAAPGSREEPVPERPARAQPTRGGGYEIAPLGSVQTDPAERAMIAARVQKRLDKRYAQLLERKKPAAEAVPQADSGAARALEAERWFRKGSELLKLKRYDDAVEAFGMSAHQDPSEGEYLAHLGYALYLSKPDNETVRREALEDIARGIKLSPDRELPYVYLGRIFKVQGELENARKMFQRALKIRPHCRLAAQEIRLMDMREQKKGGGLLSRFLKS